MIPNEKPLTSTLEEKQQPRVLVVASMKNPGLAIALGEVVDDAVVGVENMHRRLRENRGLPQPQSAFKVMLRATLEVRKAGSSGARSSRIKPRAGVTVSATTSEETMAKM